MFKVTRQQVHERLS